MAGDTALRLALAALALSALIGAAAETSPMTEEEVVRQFVAHRPVAEILSQIESREPAFDLSPEMLEELRRSGIPEALIAAMTRRARELAPAAPRPEELGPPRASPTLRLRLHAREVSVARRIDPQLAAEWELGNAPEDRAFSDLALYLACVTPEHVPDQWRLASPLGRDFHSMPRHQLLLFLSATSGEAGPADGRIAFDLPEQIEVALEPGEAHDLRLGLALQVSGHYRRVADDAWPGAVVGDVGLDLEARLRGRRVDAFEVRFVRGGDGEEQDEEPDDEEQGGR